MLPLLVIKNVIIVVESLVNISLEGKFSLQFYTFKVHTFKFLFIYSNFQFFFVFFQFLGFHGHVNQ
jgi:hypothetical protein